MATNFELGTPELRGHAIVTTVTRKDGPQTMEVYTSPPELVLTLFDESTNSNAGSTRMSLQDAALAEPASCEQDLDHTGVGDGHYRAEVTVVEAFNTTATAETKPRVKKEGGSWSAST